MTIPDSAEYWWDIRGYSDCYSGNAQSKRSPIVSIEKMIADDNYHTRLSEADKLRVKRTICELGWCSTMKEAGMLINDRKMQYRDILLFFKENNIKLLG